MILGNSLKLTTSELIPIRDLVAEVAGIHFDEKKFYFVEKRVLRRMTATSSKTAKDYFRLLKLGGDVDELSELIAALTTNETYFYRNIPQLESFAEEALPLILEEKRQRRDFQLRIWSAACSSGEEPYTISILLKEHIPDYTKWRIEIIATDIDHTMLDKAKTGIYEKRAVKDVQPSLLAKYFSNQGSKYQVKPDVRRGINFQRLNLMDRRAMRMQTRMDFVFCRNVLIYFDDEARKQVVSRIYDSLNKGGFIFLGHSESVGKISAVFKLVKFKKSLTYRK
ncbi:MAG: chemotaxis protein [SAR324 cluster bacterium]|uniref:protein-glutamate O-methyltransferase n=1 Tax=SAR324 cluster bacterium TaxID=2024889 RepID=A0A2A4TB11_9DELT|nr:MAG: chemotaxis protein [SAR324 cluster bacterium]